MKIRYLLMVLMVFAHPHVFAGASSIDGAFGIKLGEKPGNKYGSEKVQVPDGVLYFIDPPIKNKHFDEYAILITKATKKVHRIYAEKKHGGDKCDSHLQLIKRILEKRYGLFAKQKNVYILRQGQREIRLTCRENITNPSEAALQLVYRDNNIFAEGKKALMINKDDGKGL